MERGTCKQWLDYLDRLQVPDEAWRDPEFVNSVAWLMICFIPRRLGQRLAEASGCPLVTGTDLRERHLHPGETPDPMTWWQ